MSMGRMSFKHILKGLSLGAMLIGATVTAQPAEGQDEPDAELSFRKGSQLSAQEQLAQSEAYITQMKQALEHMHRLAEQARKEKDLIKLNCVNDKLIQSKGHINLAETAREALRIAAARGDEGTRSHEFAKLTIHYQKVTVLSQEAEACIGEEISYVGTTRVDVDVDQDIPEEDPTEIPMGPLPIVRPPLASPFL